MAGKGKTERRNVLFVSIYCSRQKKKEEKKSKGAPDAVNRLIEFARSRLLCASVEQGCVGV